MTDQITSKSQAGAQVYSKTALKLYDWWVLGFSNRFLWKCPTKVLEHHFRANVSDNHLDIGVGTGYYLEHCLTNRTMNLALLDLNQNSLLEASKRAKHFSPQCFHADVLVPFELNNMRFDSVSMNYLLHCLPESIKEKSVVFHNLLPHLNDGAIIFGSTIVGDNNSALNAFAKKLMALYNSKGIFSNTNDTKQDLEQALGSVFSDVRVGMCGAVALFRAIYKK